MILRSPKLPALGALALLFASCSRSAVPKSELSRGAPSAISSDLLIERGEEINLVSPTGAPLIGKLELPDLLLPRSQEIEKLMEPGNSIRPFGPVFFDFDKFNLSSEERVKVIEVAAFLQENRTARLLIEGYCDWKGTPAYNKSLGARRAHAIKEYLIELGADPRRIDTLSLGDEAADPLAPDARMRLDRKAEFVIAKGE